MDHVFCALLMYNMLRYVFEHHNKDNVFIDDIK